MLKLGIDVCQATVAKYWRGPMMLSDSHQKVTAAHLLRGAYLYVRQSTIRQVFENTESTTRQFALRDGRRSKAHRPPQVHGCGASWNVSRLCR